MVVFRVKALCILLCEGVMPGAHVGRPTRSGDSTGREGGKERGGRRHRMVVSV